MKAARRVETIKRVVEEDMAYVHKKFGRLRKDRKTSIDQENTNSALNDKCEDNFHDIAAYSTGDEAEEPKAKRQCKYLPFRPWEVKPKSINELVMPPTPPNTPPLADLLQKPAAGEIKAAISNRNVTHKSTPKMQINLHMSMPRMNHLPYSPVFPPTTSMMPKTMLPAAVNLMPPHFWYDIQSMAQLSNAAVLPAFQAPQFIIASTASPKLCATKNEYPPKPSAFRFAPSATRATAQTTSIPAKKRGRNSSSTQATREILNIVTENNAAILQKLMPYCPNMARQFPTKVRTPEEQLRRERNTMACRISRRKKMLKKVLEQEIFPARLSTCNAV